MLHARIRAEAVRGRAWRCACIAHPHLQIEQVGEDDTLAEYLDGMFGPDAPPLPWDAAGAYSRAALEVYYQVRVHALCG
jgi:hypothetical protein